MPSPLSGKNEINASAAREGRDRCNQSLRRYGPASNSFSEEQQGERERAKKIEIAG